MFNITVQSGKIKNSVPLLDGEYEIRVIPVFNKSLKEWQEYYFSIIDEFCLHTGNSRYVIHEQFKSENNIESTKFIDQKDWTTIIEKLKFYLLNQD